MSTKLLTARLPGDLAEELDLLARADGHTTCAAVREAVRKHVADRKADRGLPECLEQAVLDRVTTARLPGDLADELDEVAGADRVTPSAAIREAIRKHVAGRKTDPAFQLRLQKVLRRDAALAQRMCAVAR